MREWLAERIDPRQEEAIRQWREAAEARLEKLREANVILRDQQVELDRLRNELAGERELVQWHAAQAAMFERAAEERRVLLERLAGS